MNTPILAAVLGFAVGTGLGFAYFGGLAWTVQSMPTHRRPALLVAGSYLARMVLLAVGLVALAVTSPVALLAALPGLIAARMLIVRKAATGTDADSRPEHDRVPGLRPKDVPRG